MGPPKVNLIFPDEPRVDEPPWTTGPATLAGIDAHFGTGCSGSGENRSQANKSSCRSTW
jgi:hypothetical protein